MKKRFLLAFLLLLCVFPVRAIDMSSGVQTAAAYFPADTKVFFAMRTDEAFLEELDMIVSSVRTQLPAEVPLPGLRDVLRQNMATSPVDFDTLMSWAGDWAAFGFSGDMTGSEGMAGYLLIHLEDQAALQAYLTENAEALNITAESDNVFIAGNTRLELVDGMAYASELNYTRPEISSSLLDSDTFQQSVGALPADRYNAVFYGDIAATMAAADTTQLGSIGMAPNGYMALGLTILDGRTFTIDVAQTDAAGETAPVSSDFTNLIPSQASAFIQATDFTASFNSLMNFARASAPENPDPVEQLSTGLQSVGIDLQDDILSWTTGNYALILRSDFAAGLANLETAMNDPVQFADFGIIFEATDAAKAQGLSSKLNSVIQMAAGSSPDVTITTETLNGTEATIISAPVQPGLTVDLAIGANDQIFFIATRRAAVALLSGETTITNNAVYQEASKYFLPNPTTIWYTDSNGLAASTIVPLAILGPSIGAVYDNIQRGLETPSSSMNDSQTFTVSTQNQVGQPEVEIMQTLLGMLHSGTVTSTVIDGTRVVRVTLSLNLK